MSNKVEIEAVDNGFIVEYNTSKEVWLELEEVFADLLLHFEGLAETFHGPAYGKVTVQRGQDEKTPTMPARPTGEIE
jgi:hypothetical protein